MRTYTLTTGESTKLLATETGTTRTVTTLRGLDPDAARQLAVDLSALTNDLAGQSAPWAPFAQHATALGVRYAQLVPAEQTLALSPLADLPVPVGAKWAQFKHHPVAAIGRTLTTAAPLPDPAQRAVRSELRDLLARFDGLVVTATVGTLDGPCAFNIAEFVAEADPDALAALVCDSGRGRFVGSEDVVEFYTRPGRLLDGLGAELEAADWDVYIDVGCRDVVRRLAATRPDVLATVVAEPDPNDPDDPETRELIDLARRLLAEPARH